MKLSQCTIGTLVIQYKPYDCPTMPRIGHVVGLEVNNIGETIPTVQFAAPHRPFAQAAKPNEPVGVHHNNLQLYAD